MVFAKARAFESSAVSERFKRGHSLVVVNVLRSGHNFAIGNNESPLRDDRFGRANHDHCFEPIACKNDSENLANCTPMAYSLNNESPIYEC